MHSIWHGSVPPHSTVQSVLPEHSALQPPFGQRMTHVLLPPQATVEPVSTSTLQLLPPAHVTSLFTPVEMVHVLAPLQLEVQLAVQLPAHSD